MMKKTIALLMILVMVLGMAVGCDNTANTSAPSENGGETVAELDMTATPSESYTIAWAITSADEATEGIKKYLEEEIGPAINVKFIFSEVLSSTDDLLTFMENAYSSGADAIINSLPSAIEAAATKAEELGLYIVSNSSSNFPSVETLERNVGIVGVSAVLQGEVFSDVASNIMDDGKAHNVIIVSGGASMGIRSHFESTKGLLSMLQEKYDLTYDKSLDDIAKLSAITEINTGTDTKITIFPGFGGPTFVSDFSSLLQTGDYDIALSTFAAFTTFAVAIDEAEKALKMDVKMISVTGVNAPTLTAFTNIDSQGSTVLAAAVINPDLIAIGAATAMLYNALSGHKAAICPDGISIILGTKPWAVNGAEDYNALSKLDTSHDTYSLNSDDLKKLLFIYNHDVNYDYLVAALADMSAENLIKNKLQ